MNQFNFSAGQCTSNGTAIYLIVIPWKNHSIISIYMTIVPYLSISGALNAIPNRAILQGRNKAAMNHSRHF